MKRQILDAPFEEEIKLRVPLELSEEETVLWKGIPLMSSSAFDKYHPKNLDGKAKKYTLVILAICFGLMFSWTFVQNIQHVFYTIFTALFIAFIIFIPDLHLLLRRKNTRYVLTSERIIFYLWYWGRKSTHYIPLEEVRSVSLSRSIEIPKAGNIYFVTKAMFTPDFYTYDFFNDEKRRRPTLENIKDVEHVNTLLEKAISERKQK